MDLQSVFCYWRRGELGWQDVLRSWRGPKAYAVFSWKDTLPFLADLVRAMGRPFSRRGRDYWRRITAPSPSVRDGRPLRRIQPDGALRPRQAELRRG